MRTIIIVVAAKYLKAHTRLSNRGEELHIQAFVAHRPIEALVLAVLPGAAWVDIQRLYLPLCKPGLHNHCNEFRAVVAAQIRWRTVRGHQLYQHTDDSLSRRAALDINGEPFTRKLIHHR